MTRKKIKKGNIRKKNRIISRLNRKNPKVKRRNTKKVRDKKSLRGGATAANFGLLKKTMKNLRSTSTTYGLKKKPALEKMTARLYPQYLQKIQEKLYNEIETLYRSLGNVKSLMDQTGLSILQIIESKLSIENFIKDSSKILSALSEYISKGIPYQIVFYYQLRKLQEEYKNENLEPYFSLLFNPNVYGRLFNIIRRELNYSNIYQNVNINLVSTVLCVHLHNKGNKEYIQLPENCRQKNRYSNIIPFSRNVLTTDGSVLSDDCSNYLNASKINIAETGSLLFNDSIFNPNPNTFEPDIYVAAQGPLPQTMEDFLEAIIANHVSIIVQVTENMEGSRTKCFNYLDGYNGTELSLEKVHQIEIPVFLDFDVQYYKQIIMETSNLVSNTEESYTLRVFDLKKNGNTVRKIFHVKYNNWPDHGTPDRIFMFEEFINFIYQLQRCDLQKYSYNSNSNFNLINIDFLGVKSKTLVHCSAGVGRTGLTILALLKEELKEKLKNSNVFKNKILEIIICLKMQRLNLIHTEDQFIFALDYMQS